MVKQIIIKQNEFEIKEFLESKKNAIRIFMKNRNLVFEVSNKKNISKRQSNKLLKLLKKNKNKIYEEYGFDDNDFEKVSKEINV